MHPEFKIKFIETHLPDCYIRIKNKLKTEFSSCEEDILESSSSTQTSQTTKSFWDSDDDEISATHLENFWYSSEKSLNILNEKKFKTVKKLFLKFNTALPSSAPVERLFSQAKHVLTPERNKISDSHFEMQLLLHENS